MADNLDRWKCIMQEIVNTCCLTMTDPQQIVHNQPTFGLSSFRPEPNPFIYESRV